MKQFASGLILCLVASALYGQIVFEPGYIISRDGQRTACQIRNMDWKNNPKSFTYRLGDDTQSIEGSIDNITEFGVTGGATFRRFDGQIDRSSNLVERLSPSRDPEFARETLFLRLLVNGKASLYQYKEDMFERYFYSVDQMPVEQLVYKRYLTQANVEYSRFKTSSIGENVAYKQTLFNVLKCEGITEADMKKLNYVVKDLVKLFSKYNNCQGATTSTVMEQAEKKGILHWNLRPGLTYNSLQVKNTVNSSSSVDFGSNPSYRVGVEVENILPFNKGVWALIFEPVYQAYAADGNTGTQTVKVDYKSMELGLGMRRFFFLKGNGKIFVNASAVLDLPFSSTIIYSNSSIPLEISSGLNVTLGGGYTVNRFALELRYNFRRGLLGEYPSFSSAYGGPALIIGYRIN